MSTTESDFGQGYHEQGHEPKKDYVSHEDHVSGGFHKMGETLPYPDVVEDAVSGFMNPGQSTYTAPADHMHSFLLASVSGVPADSMFTHPKVGIMCLDTTNNRLYVRCPAGWKYTALI